MKSMLIRLLPATLLLAWGFPPAGAQTTAPIPNPTSLAFSYQINSTTLPTAKTIQISVPTALASSTLTVTSDSASPWIAATPDTGRAPMTVTVNVNPTSLSPGSFTGWVKISATATAYVSVPVVLSITSPAATLSIASSSANYTSTSTPTAFAFTYVTGDTDATPASSQLNVASTGDTVNFTATAATTSTSNWLRVAVQGQLASTKTSGVALSGSYVPLVITLDSVTLATLSPGSYTGTITLKGNNTVTVAVNLVVSAGAPTVTSMFPTSVVMGTTVPPVLTITGDNFFSTSVVTLTALTPASGTMPSGVPTTAQTIPATLLSRKKLSATIPVTLLAWQLSWVVKVTNPAPSSNPSQQPATSPSNFTVASATAPTISSIANAASYLSTAEFTGTVSSNNPLPGGGTSVAPREMISIFGQNLGPSTAVIASPSATTPAVFSSAALSNMQVGVNIGGTVTYAPLIMVSANQINAIVPVSVTTAATVGIFVVNSSTGEQTALWTATVVPADPGVFTFGGLGKGQAAVLNYDSATNTTVVNSTKDTAAKGSAIEIFATGLGEYDTSTTTMLDGEVPTAVINLASSTIRVEIAGQSAVVTYAGTSPGAVAGLVQINAIVPPTVSTGQAIPVTVSYGAATSSRRSQASVTLGVK